MKVLIADDHPLVRDALMRTLLLVDPDAQVLQAADYAAALHLLQTEGPQLALLDLHMPGMDRVEGLRRLRLLFPAVVFFRMTPVDYFEGEDLPGPASAISAPATPQATCLPPSSAFSTRLCHVDDLPWESWSSPRGRFRGASKELSIALGARRNTPTGLGGHPFDLEWGRLLPGECGCPYHSHSAQWEVFLFVEGTASVRTPSGTAVHRAGDVVLHPPGEPHQFTNTGADDLIFVLIADNPLADIWHYPDSDKWGFRLPRKIFRATDTDYWEGEE